MHATQINLGLTHGYHEGARFRVCYYQSLRDLFKVFFFGFTLFPSTFIYFKKHVSENSISYSFVNQKIVNRSNSAKANHSFELRSIGFYVRILISTMTSPQSSIVILCFCILHVKSYIFSLWMYSKYKPKRTKNDGFVQNSFIAIFEMKCVFSA